MYFLLSFGTVHHLPSIYHLKLVLTYPLGFFFLCVCVFFFFKPLYTCFMASAGNSITKKEKKNSINSTTVFSHRNTLLLQQTKCLAHVYVQSTVPAAKI